MELAPSLSPGPYILKMFCFFLFFFPDLSPDQTLLLCCVKPATDCVNTGADSSCRTGDIRKNKQLLCYCHRQRRESEACINTSSLYHPPTYCRTHSLTPSLSHKHTLFPFLLQDTHLHRIIRLAAGDLAPLTGPVCGGD